MPKAPKGIQGSIRTRRPSHMGDRCVAATSLRCCGGTPGDQDGRGTNELSKIESILGTRMSQIFHEIEDSLGSCSATGARWTACPARWTREASSPGHSAICDRPGPGLAPALSLCVPIFMDSPEASAVEFRLQQGPDPNSNGLTFVVRMTPCGSAPFVCAQMTRKAILVLEDGTVFRGRSIGAEGQTVARWCSTPP